MHLFDRSRPSRALVRALVETGIWVFDWDGTLLDSIGRTLATYREIFEELDLPFDERAFQDAYSPNWRRMYQRLGVPGELWDRIDQRWVEIYEVEVSRLVPAAAETLDWLRRHGRRLALVTAGHRERVELELRANGLVGVFETAVYGDETPHQKPDPSALLLAARYLRASPQEMVLVGDAPEDMRMARRAGALAIGVLTGASSRGKLRSGGARWVAPDVAAVLAAIREATS
jgi:phosphoglycolate phosphatase